MTINLHFTSGKNIDNEKTQTNKITRSPIPIYRKGISYSIR